MFRFVLAAAALAAPTLAWCDASCSVTLEGTDQMTYNTTTITVPASCKQFSVTLTHSGEMPKAVMGHNWVLSAAQDMDAVIDDGASAGEAENYIKPQDPRVLAHTKVIGAGEQDTVTFNTDLLKPATNYVFFCSFPVHAAMMKGTLTRG